MGGGCGWSLLEEEEEEEEFITSGNWRGKHNSLSRGAGADQGSGPLIVAVLYWPLALHPEVRFA